MQVIAGCLGACAADAPEWHALRTPNERWHSEPQQGRGEQLFSPRWDARRWLLAAAGRRTRTSPRVRREVPGLLGALRRGALLPAPAELSPETAVQSQAVGTSRRAVDE